MSTSLKIDLIRTDGGTQPRAAIDFDAVDDYTDAMEVGTKFPPVVVFYDGDSYWLADGFHRLKAAEQAGWQEIHCDLHPGTLEDAQWYSCSANKSNGLRRTNDDKGRAIRAALLHPRSSILSDRQIAHHVGVDHTTVLRWRDKLAASGALHQIETRTATRGSQTYEMNVEQIGRRPDVAITDPAERWRRRLLRLCSEIGASAMPAAAVAAVIVNHPDHAEIVSALEKAHGYLTDLTAALSQQA